MVVIDFGNISGVNMDKPGALGRVILSGFNGFNFRTGSFSDPVLEIPATNNNAFVNAFGTNWAFHPDGTPLANSPVYALEVWGPAGAYRIVVNGLDIAFGDLRRALLDRNLSPLWAGERLQVLGSVGSGDTLVGGNRGDELYGYGGNDLVIGNAGNDYLDGMAGVDTMIGGLGNDTFVVNHAADAVSEGAGEGLDFAISAIDYTLPQFVEDLALLDGGGAIDGNGNGRDNFLEGNASVNRLQGLAGDDTIAGAGGRDLLNGGDGNDSLEGGGDADQLRGGAGNDSLVWHSPDAGVDGGTGTDTLVIVSGNLDLRDVANARIADIERIRLPGATRSVLVLELRDVLDLSSSTDAIRVLGNAGDTVNIVGQFDEGGTSGGFTTYRLGGGAARLQVDADIDVV